jgi:hypothetical protein
MLRGIFEPTNSEYCKNEQNYKRSFIICTLPYFATDRMRWAGIYMRNETYIKGNSKRACNEHL